VVAAAAKCSSTCDRSPVFPARFCGITARLWIGRFRAADARRLPAEPVVMEDDPDELAVPALLVPGGGGDATLAELPAPLESLPELLSPPAPAGPDGTPLTPAVPAPAEPALGEPTALLPRRRPAGGSACACAAAALRERTGGTSKKRDAITDIVTDIPAIGKSPF